MTETVAEQATKLRQIKLAAARAVDRGKELSAEAQAAELALFERMEHDNISGIKVGDTNFIPISTNYGQVQDRAAFIEWAQTEQPELVETKERKALVNELIREALDNGDPMPPGLGFYTKQYISQRAS